MENIIELNGNYKRNGIPATYLEVGYSISVHFENDENVDFFQYNPQDMWKIISTISGCDFVGKNKIRLDGSIEDTQSSMYNDEYDVAVSLNYDEDEIFVEWLNNRDGSVSKTNLLHVVDSVDKNLDGYVWEILDSVEKSVYRER